MCGVSKMEWSYLLFVLLVFPTAIRSNDICYEIQDGTYYDFYLKLEEALIGNTALMERMRVIFLHSEVVSVDFSVNFTANSIYNYDDSATFCRSSYSWQLCRNCSLEDIVFSSQTVDKLSSDERKLQIVGLITYYLSFLHGNIMSVYILFLPSNYFLEYDIAFHKYVPMQLSLNSLDYNPSCRLTKCALIDLLSWVSKAIMCNGCYLLLFCSYHRLKFIPFLNQEKNPWHGMKLEKEQ